jgi:GNAT superfamily N-acetyltransferase
MPKNEKTYTAVSTAGNFRISKIIHRWWHKWSDDKKRIFYWHLTNPTEYDDLPDWDTYDYYKNSYLRCVLPWDGRKPSKYETWVAYFDGEAIAWLVIEWNKSNQGMLHVFVKEEFRRLGVGTTLMDKAIRKYPNKRFRMYHWEPASRAFYLQQKKLHKEKDLVVLKEG